MSRNGRAGKVDSGARERAVVHIDCHRLLYGADLGRRSLSTGRDTSMSRSAGDVMVRAGVSRWTGVLWTVAEGWTRSGSRPGEICRLSREGVRRGVDGWWSG